MAENKEKQMTCFSCRFSIDSEQGLRCKHKTITVPHEMRNCSCSEYQPGTDEKERAK